MRLNEIFSIFSFFFFYEQKIIIAENNQKIYQHWEGVGGIQEGTRIDGGARWMRGPLRTRGGWARFREHFARAKCPEKASTTREIPATLEWTPAAWNRAARSWNSAWIVRRAYGRSGIEKRRNAAKLVSLERSGRKKRCSRSEMLSTDSRQKNRILFDATRGKGGQQAGRNRNR